MSDQQPSFSFNGFSFIRYQKNLRMYNPSTKIRVRELSKIRRLVTFGNPPFLALSTAQFQLGTGLPLFESWPKFQNPVTSTLTLPHVHKKKFKSSSPTCRPNENCASLRNSFQRMQENNELRTSSLLFFKEFLQHTFIWKNTKICVKFLTMNSACDEYRVDVGCICSFNVVMKRITYMDGP